MRGEDASFTYEDCQVAMNRLQSSKQQFATKKGERREKKDGEKIWGEMQRSTWYKPASPTPKAQVKRPILLGLAIRRRVLLRASLQFH